VAVSRFDMCSHLTTYFCQRDGHDVCADCGFVFPAVGKSIEWIPSIDDERQRGDAPLADTDDEEEISTNVGISSLVPYQYSIASKGSYSKRKVYKDGQMFIRHVCQDLNLNSAVEIEALNIFRVMKSQFCAWRGTRRVGVQIAAISLACQQLSIGMTDAEILKAERVRQPAKVMNLHKKLVMQVLHSHNRSMIPDRPAPSEYAMRLCDQLGLESNLRRVISNTCLRVAMLDHMTSRAPAVIVAVSILHVLEKHNLSMNISELCKVVSVTRPTLVKWYSHACMRDTVTSRLAIQKLEASCLIIM